MSNAKGGSGASDSLGYTFAMIFLVAGTERCGPGKKCRKHVLIQDVTVLGSMAWRQMTYSGRSGRTVEEHEKLHYSYVLDAANKIDRYAHAVVDGKCYDSSCVHKRHTYLYAVKNYFDTERELKDAQLEEEDYISGLPELQKKNQRIAEKT